MQKYDDIYPIERIVSAATYVTAGGAGFIWLIIAAIMKKTVRPFLMYHILQSIFLSILFYLIKVFAGLIMIILLKIPVITYVASTIGFILTAPLPLLFNWHIIQLATTVIMLYLAISSFMGYDSYIPWVSDIIKGNTLR